MIKAAKIKKAKKSQMPTVETLQHKTAFEAYYLMGGKRSVKKVAEVMGTGITAIGNWRRVFDWKNKIIIRDKKIATAIEKADDKKLIKDKIEYRTQVKELLTVLRAAIQVAVNTIRSGGILYDVDGNEVRVSSFNCNTADGLSKVAAAIERLMRLDLTLMGEPEERREMIMKWVYEDGNGEMPIIEQVAEFEGKDDGNEQERRD